MSNTIVRKGKKSSFIKGSFKRYLFNSTPLELVFDWVYPFAISLIIFIVIISLDKSSSSLLLILTKLNDVSINVIAILAGFNTASLAIIASTNRSIFKKSLNSSSATDTHVTSDDELKEDVPLTTNKSLIKRGKNLILNNNTSDKLETTLSFFSYAVISQLSILIIGIAINLLLNALLKVKGFIFTINDTVEAISLFSFGVCWMSLILHVIFISIRNVDMIYHFIIYKDENS
ncbi:hypothetical protein CD798_08275 [Bacillaceae bacterium SAOS 7]|nr:hypothetical protein CD798_08275 [Bacillaceae bacterium SAOS 7]